MSFLLLCTFTYISHCYMHSWCLCACWLWREGGGDCLGSFPLGLCLLLILFSTPSSSCKVTTLLECFFLHNTQITVLLYYSTALWMPYLLSCYYCTLLSSLLSLLLYSLYNFIKLIPLSFQYHITSLHISPSCLLLQYLLIITFHTTALPLLTAVLPYVLHKQNLFWKVYINHHYCVTIQLFIKFPFSSPSHSILTSVNNFRLGWPRILSD